MSFDFLTIEEAASKVRVTRRCFDRWIAAGDGPRLHLVGHRKLIHVDDFQVWLEGLAQCQASEVETSPLLPPAPAAYEAASA